MEGKRGEFFYNENIIINYKINFKILIFVLYYKCSKKILYEITLKNNINPLFSIYNSI